MIYADLPAGAAVFLDASVFIHHFEPNAVFGPIKRHPMNFSIDAIYENGVLKPTSPLPLDEHARVRVLVQEVAVERKLTPEDSLAAIRSTASILGRTGDPEILRRIAEDDEFSILESP